jgi:hypothetical protein
MCIFAEKIRNMAINIISAKRFATKLKATIQRSGRLGLTEETARYMNLADGKYAKFAQDDENGTLYLTIIDKRNEDCFDIRSSSGYYFIPTKMMFDSLGVDYEKNVVMFDLVRKPSLDETLGGQVFLMKSRTSKRKDKKEEYIDK